MSGNAKSTELTTQKTASELLVKAAAELSSGDGMGRMLRFKKGHYYIGDDEIAIGREYVAHCTQLARGWVKFGDDKLLEQRIGKVIDGFTPAKRDELGDLDKNKWDTDLAGKPLDPWVSQVYLPLEDRETGELVVFVTGSHGGRTAVGSLCNQAARNLARGNPIIRIDVRSYKHKVYDRIETPLFVVVGFTEVPPKPTQSVGEEMNDALPF
jgi:hypothetical protein